MRGKAALAALALLISCLALRSPRGDLCEFKGDEAIQFRTARAIAREGARPLRGTPTTDGPRTAVHFFYLLAAPLVLADGPEALRLGMTALAAAAIVVFFLSARKDLGERAALAGALLLATLPDLVHRGRWAWHPNLIPPFATFALLAFLRTLRRPEGKASALLLLVSGILPLVHYAMIGLALAGGIASSWAIFRGGSRRALAGSLALLLLLYFPHFLGEWESGFRETRGALAVASGQRSGGEAEREALAYPKLASNPFRYGSFAWSLRRLDETEDRGRGEGEALGPFEVPADLLSLGLVVAGFALGSRDLARAVSRRERPSAAAAAVLFSLAGWAPFLVLRLPARQHYALAVAPSLAALAGIALSRIGKKELAALLLLALASSGILASRGALLAIEAGLSEPGSGFDLPIGEKRAACALVLERGFELSPDLEKRRGYPVEFLVLLEDELRELARRSPERARDFETRRVRVPYWEIELALPRPKGPHERVELALLPPLEPIEGEVARSGRIALVRAKE